MSDILQAIVAATELTGDDGRATDWSNNERLVDYRYKTPAELIREDRFDVVVAHLDDLRNGANG